MAPCWLVSRVDKERKYAELLVDDSCQLVVVGVETGGSWSRGRKLHRTLGLFSSMRGAPSTPFFSIPGVEASGYSQSLGVARSQTLWSSRDDTMAGTDGASLDLADLFTAEKVLDSFVS